jgi:hypothetical protein
MKLTNRKSKITLGEHEYFQQMHLDTHAAVGLHVEAPYTLHITFDDDKQVTIDFTDALTYVYSGEMYGPLRDPAYFAQAKIMYHGVVTWPNGADINPAHLYDWPKWMANYVAEEKAKKLGGTTSSFETTG